MRFRSGSYEIQPHTVPPPILQASGGQVCTPRSALLSLQKKGLKSGPISTSVSGPVLKAFHLIAPFLASTAVSQPRTPYSPPLLPTRTLPFTTSGAMVMVSPLLISPSRVFHRCLPL